MNPTSLTLRSFAKINWSLRILGKRPDGYHNLRTVLQTVSLCDDLHFELIQADEIRLACNDPGIPTDQSNLVMRATTALRQRHGVAQGASIHLVKRIPTKAGLGGGSSNAAVTLLALCYLWSIKPAAEELLRIAADLGADVPFFLMGGTVLAKGRGTELSALPDREERHLVIVSPNAEVSTAEAYQAVDRVALTTRDHKPILSSSPDEADFGVLPLGAANSDWHNDFESVIFDISPEIKRAKQALLRAGANKALLAGSGSSVFGMFSNLQSQQKAISTMQLEPGWQVYPCVTLSRNEYCRALSVGDFSLAGSFKFGT